MILTIDDKLQIVSSEGLDPVDSARFGVEVLISGRVLGAYDDNQVYGGKATLDEVLERIDHFAKLRRFMRGTIGSFVLIIRSSEEIAFWCSPASPGFMFTEKDGRLLMSDCERYLLREARDQPLNGMELAQLVFTQFPSPYNTIFEDTTRVPGGHVLFVRQGLDVELNMYMLMGPSEFRQSETLTRLSSAYDHFADACRGVVSCLGTIPKSTYVMLSGGIDSANVLASLVKEGAEVEPLVASILGNGLDPVVKASIVGDAIGVEPEVVWVDRFSARMTEALKDDFSSTLAAHVIMGIPIHYGVRDRVRRDDGRVLVLDGQNFDAGWGIATKLHLHQQRKKSLMGYARFFWKWMGGVQTRFSGTTLYQGVLARRSSNWIEAPRPGQHLMDGFQRYLLSYLWHTERRYEGGALTLPFPVSLDSFSKEFYSHKTETVLWQAVDSDTRDRIRRGAITGRYLNHLCKCLKYLTYSSNAYRWRHATWGCTSGDFVMPASEGPLLKFFLSHQLSVREAIYPKQIAYDYFRRSTGVDYFKLMGDVYGEYARRRSEMYEKRWGRSVPCRVTRSSIVKSKWYAENVLPLLDHRRSVLVDRVENFTLRETITQAMKQAQYGCLHYRVMIKLFVVESFFRRIYGLA